MFLESVLRFACRNAILWVIGHFRGDTSSPFKGISHKEASLFNADSRLRIAEKMVGRHNYFRYLIVTVLGWQGWLFCNLTGNMVLFIAQKVVNSVFSQYSLFVCNKFSPFYINFEHFPAPQVCHYGNLL